MNFNRLVLNLIVLLTILNLISCGDKENEINWQKDSTNKSNQTDTSMEKDIEIKDLQVDSLKFGPAIDVFRVTMNDLMDSYMSISYPLCFDKPDGIKTGTYLFKDMISKTDSTSLSGDMRSYWNDYRVALEKAILDLESADGLKAQRYYYSQLSRLMTPIVKNYGVKDKVIIKYYCDKALDGKGAFWYFEDSPSYTKMNPYLGGETTECMKIVETIQPPKNQPIKELSK